MDFVDVIDSNGRRRRVELDRPRLLIGREPSCDIVLHHPGVSRRHAQLQATEQGRWLLQDLSSRNHVFVDNKPIQQIVLEPGKPFRIGEYLLKLEIGQTVSEPDRPDAGAALLDPDDMPDPAWLEQMHSFQRHLFRAEEPKAALERLAQEFQQFLKPRVLAIGISRPTGYTWELNLVDDTAPPRDLGLDEADRRISEDGVSSVRSWVPGADRGNTYHGVERDLGTIAGGLAILVPMKGRAGMVGHVYLQDPARKPVPRSILRYLTVLAGLTGLMWDTLNLAALRLGQIALEKELEQARQIQIGLFPPDFDFDHRLDVFAVNLPSAHVSGDYYDLIRIAPDKIAFVIADAMGHGMPAALLMAAVRSALHMGLTLNLPWPSIFKGLDDVTARSHSDIFVTGLVGCLDLQRKELALVCAGHPLPSILVDGIPVDLPDRCRTRPWGLEIPTTWEVGSIPLAGRDWSILCYTDGITDAAARTQRAFGAQRIAAFHKERTRAGAEDLCQGLLSEVAVQPGQRSLEDDQTVLCLRSKG
jgi:hypothetical protein